MTEEDLIDEAYRIATGNYLTKSFTFSEFKNNDISQYLWEMVEDWPLDVVKVHIVGLAEQIINTAKKYEEW